MKSLKLAAFLLFLCTLCNSAMSNDTPPSTGVGQLGVPVSWISVPGSDDTFFMAQRTRDGRLLLTANEAFFPKGRLQASGTGSVADIDNLNGGKSFATIEKWDAGDVAEWGLFVEHPGEITLHVWMSAKTSDGRFSLQLDDTAKPLKTRSAVDAPALVASETFDVKDPGQHTLKLVCDKAVPKTALRWIEVSGPAAEDSAVLRKRWRPAAAHTKFSSSQTADNIRLWVMEMDAVPGDLEFYCPITTPFGYYGPTWLADGTVNTGFNFSLWSYGRGKPEPPVEKLSHLLAIGNRNAKFSGFGHEGTGVKIRDWQPLAGRQGQRQAVALRVQPGSVYDTYFSYFYAADENRWRLFGVGNKHNGGKPLKSLWVGSFVEVPGPPPVQRTGPYERIMRYRGWVMDENESWFPLDQMSYGNVNRDTGLTHTARGVTDNGWFMLQIGGWTFRKAPKSGHVKLPSRTNDALPEYMKPDAIAFLKTVPSEITATISKRTADRVQGTFHVENLGKDATVTVYHGTKEGLTFADRWNKQMTIMAPREGDNIFTIEDVPPNQEIHIRLLLQNNEGQFWTPQTVKAEAVQLACSTRVVKTDLCGVLGLR